MDVGFVQHMIPHHQQAIEMADLILAKPGIDSRVTDLAAEIKAGQGPEVVQMQEWLGQWGNPPMPARSPDDGHGGRDMGMMSQDQMTALKNAQGGAASRLFLTGMIAHHEGAIKMAEPEIGNGCSRPPSIWRARSSSPSSRRSTP